MYRGSRRVNPLRADRPRRAPLLHSTSAVAQINELLCKVHRHNLCVLIQSMYELGIEQEF